MKYKYVFAHQLQEMTKICISTLKIIKAKCGSPGEIWFFALHALIPFGILTRGRFIILLFTVMHCNVLFTYLILIFTYNKLKIHPLVKDD